MRKRKNIPTQQAFAVVVDSETEYWYLQMLKRNEPNILFDIMPKFLQKKNVTQQYKLVTELSKKEYDKVFWIIDLDILLKEEREKKDTPSSLQKFLNYWQQLSKQDKVVVIVNNPCLEYWFLLHFQRLLKCLQLVQQPKNKLANIYEVMRKQKNSLRNLMIFTNN